jgi:hypothetical protein
MSPNEVRQQAVEDLGFLFEHEAGSGIAVIIAERRRRVEAALHIPAGRSPRAGLEKAGVDLAGAGALAAAHLDQLLRKQNAGGDSPTP